MVQERASNQTLVWNQPAGHVEVGEQLVDAAVRETLEESGWLVEIDYLIGVYTFQPEPGAHFCRFCFAGRPVRQVTSALDPDIIRASWLSPDELLADPDTWRSRLVGDAINDYRAGKRFSLDLLHEDPTLSAAT
ncbi:NUDIX domain-containing protein [Pokkaliibacter sp. CJK22405]|uniref:NUDIX domain-containing protein n=1 Tax=Pokkaliibacter sp. CJK22405 TaxID=3384615 RepID=UPI00398479A5